MRGLVGCVIGLCGQHDQPLARVIHVAADGADDVFCRCCNASGDAGFVVACVDARFVSG